MPRGKNTNTIHINTNDQPNMGNQEQNAGKKRTTPLIDELRKRIRERIGTDKLNRKKTNLTIWAYKKVLIELTVDDKII